MPFVSVTRLRIRSPRYLPMLFLQAARSAWQARQAPGSLKVSLLREANRTFWTRTLWSDEKSMRAFQSAEPHGKVMRQLADWCDEASVVHWNQDSAELPAWPQAHRRMQQEGRPSRVNQPSEAHVAYRVPAPQVSGFGDIDFK